MTFGIATLIIELAKTMQKNAISATTVTTHRYLGPKRAKRTSLVLIRECDYRGAELRSIARRVNRPYNQKYGSRILSDGRKTFIYGRIRSLCCRG